jgi:hypothetical protein
MADPLPKPVDIRLETRCAEGLAVPDDRLDDLPDNTYRVVADKELDQASSAAVSGWAKRYR